MFKKFLNIRFKLLKSLIYLTILLASIKSSNALITFLIATFLFLCLSKADATTPYAPEPICFKT